MRLNVPGHGCYCPVQLNGIYISTENVNPSSYWPGTSWSLYGKDRFLLGAGSSYAGGATGGEAAHKLSVSEMPSHNHNPSAGMLIVGDLGNRAFAQGGYGYAPSGNLGRLVSVGGNAAHNNMPPYVAVYFWRRIS